MSYNVQLLQRKGAITHSQSSSQEKTRKNTSFWASEALAFIPNRQTTHAKRYKTLADTVEAHRPPKQKFVKRSDVRNVYPRPPPPRDAWSL